MPSSKTNVPILALKVLQIQCQEKLVTSHEGHSRDTRQGLCHGWQRADQKHECLQVCHLWFNHCSDQKAQIPWQKTLWCAESTLKIKFKKIFLSPAPMDAALATLGKSLVECTTWPADTAVQNVLTVFWHSRLRKNILFWQSLKEHFVLAVQGRKIRQHHFQFLPLANESRTWGLSHAHGLTF